MKCIWIELGNVKDCEDCESRFPPTPMGCIKIRGGKPDEEA